MAKSTPGTAGSKGGGNVVPGTRFPTRGGVLRSQIPAGRGTVPDNYDYGRNMPRRFPSPQPRYPMPRNPYSQPPSRYGGMQGPTGFVANNYPYGRGMSGYNRYGGMRGPSGLGGFLAQQPPIRQRQIDFGTGFPTQQQVEQDRAEADAQAERDYIAQEAEADARETARQKEEERKRYQPGGSMSRTRPADEKTTYQQMLEGTYQPDDREKSLGYTSSSGKGGSKGGARNVKSPTPGSGTVGGQPQRNDYGFIIPDIGMPPPNTMGQFGNNPPPSPVRQDYTGSPPPMIDAGQYLRTGEIPSLSQGLPGLPERPMFQTQGPESLMGEITQSPRFQAMQMGQAGGRPNIRPAMNVGKATGGPVGLASLIGRY